MPNYRITWEIDISARNPAAAAREARKIQLDESSLATVFNVTNRASGRRWSADTNIGQAGNTLTDLPPAECTCSDRSWYGSDHDENCDLEGKRK